MKNDRAEARASSLRNIVLNWGAFLVVATSGLLLSPFILENLGAEGYGVWVLVGALTGPLTLLDLGTRSAVTRLVAHALASADAGRANAIASTARLIYWVAGALALLVSGLMAMKVTEWFEVPREMHGVAWALIMLVGGAVAVNLSTGLYSGLLAAARRLDLAGIISIVQELLRVALIVAGLFMGGGVLALAAVTLTLAALRLAMHVATVRRVVPILQLRFTRPNHADVRSILDISVFSTIIYAISTVTSQFSNYVVGSSRPLADLTTFAVGGTLVVYLQSISLPIAQNILPVATGLHARGQQQELVREVLRTVRMGTLVTMTFAAGFLARGTTFISIWMGPSLADEAGRVLIVLSIAGAFGLSKHVIQTVFIAVGAHRHLIIWYVVESIATLALGVVLVRSAGLLGAAWSVAVPALTTTLLVFPLLSRQHLQISVGAYWREAVLRPICAIAPFGVALLLSERYWSATTYLAFFAQVASLLPLALIGSFFVGLNRGERLAVLSKWRTRGVSA